MRLFLIARNGKTIFELTGREVCDSLKIGTVLPTDHYWTKGMSGWELVSSRLSWETPPPASSAGRELSRGFVLEYNFSSSAGLILADNGMRYSFVIAEWRALGVPPSQGLRVEFAVSGLDACGVRPYRGSSGAAQSSSAASVRQASAFPSAAKLTTTSRIVLFAVVVTFIIVTLVFKSGDWTGRVDAASMETREVPFAASPQHVSVRSADGEELYNQGMREAGMLSAPRGDLQKARNLLLAAAEAGYPMAYYQLGFLCSQAGWPGEGKAESWKWLTLAEQTSDLSAVAKAREWKLKICEPDYWEDEGPLSAAEKSQGERLAKEYATRHR